MTRSRALAFPARMGAVWFRHMRVYTKDLASNGFPPFLEPLIFLAGMGLGLAQYVPNLAEMSYLAFLATGLVQTSAMFTASFECTYGTFIRLEFDKAYDGMLAAPLSVRDVLLGEVLWAGTMGAFFSLAVLVVVSLFGIVDFLTGLPVAAAGFLTGAMFASIGLFVTSFVKNLNHFNFYFTGLLSPMFFFCGTVFPISNLPPSLQVVSEFLPLTHSVRIGRALSMGAWDPALLLDLVYIAGVMAAILFFAVKRLERRMVH